MTELFQNLLNNSDVFKKTIESNIYLINDIKNCYINKPHLNNTFLLSFYFHNTYPKYYTFNSTTIYMGNKRISILEDIKIYNRYLNIQKL